ncbi:isopeptide-forming domain-containing fimbrial protein [Bifidobacterium sp. 64T4]|uniref:SpaA isopeptide-forming pilin-related protein n=1 Tax=Bifidobacterium pongonis TaxID=2834432 RepID=UPI001C5A0D6A|nr:isopeptide-forming domain-containing fimbrial protein [Bifidobacterium pongonis]MBW3094288.1 isopeptide-forming domain-containing fimbrial protein [Bifidobacterium pongonis]
MKTKKLFAGFSAAAALMGSLALGAASAQADETVVTDKATFTFTADDPSQLRNRKLSVYKIGDYIKYGKGDGARYGVRSTPANKQAVDAALGETLGSEYGKDGVDNLANALVDGRLDQTTDRPWAVGTTRKLANALKGQAAQMTAAEAPDMQLSGTSATGTIELPAGIYLIVDNTEATAAVTQSLAMIAASGKISNGVLTEPEAGPTVNFKNTKNLPHTKTVDQKTASLGDVLDYHLIGKVSNPKPESFMFTDQPGRGLTVKTDSLTATVDDKKVDFADYFTANFSSLKNGNLGNDKATFTVTANPDKLDELAGKNVVVSYKALVNQYAKGKSKVVNRVLKNDGDTNDPFYEVTTRLLGFEFRKVDADGRGIEGAEFEISVEGGYTGHLPTQEGPNTTVTSVKDGVVSFSGLAAGTYKVTETKVASKQYLDIKPSFVVHVAEDGTTFTTDGMDPFNLVNENKRTVLNVKSVVSLPLTGAAGTALFTAIALLLGAAGLVLVLKSRSVKNTMTD